MKTEKLILQPNLPIQPLIMLMTYHAYGFGKIQDLSTTEKSQDLSSTEKIQDLSQTEKIQDLSPTEKSIGIWDVGGSSGIGRLCCTLCTTY